MENLITHHLDNFEIASRSPSPLRCERRLLLAEQRSPGASILAPFPVKGDMRALCGARALYRPTGFTLTKRGVGQACSPDQSAKMHVGPAGASCAAFDPLFLYQAARLLLFSYPRAAFVRLNYCSPYLSIHHRVLLNGRWLRLFRQHGREARRGAHLRTSKKHRTNHYPAS